MSVAFYVVIVTVIDLEESSVKMDRWMALGYLLPSVLVYFLNRLERTLLKHLEDFPVKRPDSLSSLFSWDLKTQKTDLYAFWHLVVSSGPVVISWLQLYFRYQNCSYNRNTHRVPMKMLLCKPFKSSIYVTIENKCLYLFWGRKDCIIFAWVFELFIAEFCTGLHGNIKSLIKSSWKHE